MKNLLLVLSLATSDSAQAFCYIPNASNPLEMQAYNRCLIEQRQAEALERQNQIIEQQQILRNNQLRQHINDSQWDLYQPYNFYE